MTVSIRLLGGFEVRHGDATVIDGAWKPAKAAAIVKILALQPRRTMHRDQLIDLLWPEADAEAGSSSFYKNIHHLRTAARKAGVEDLIVLSRGAVTLDPDAVLDIDTMREDARLAFASRELPAFERAIASCGGELLPADLYEPWTEGHRGEFRTLQQRLRFELAERYIQRRRFDDSVAQYHAVLAINPLSEEAHRGLMRAYGMEGQRDLALRQYDRLCELLASELSATPATETETLAAEIRSVERLTNAVEAAIAEPLLAADGAMRRRDYAEAIAGYRDAIDRLHAAGPDDEREADLWLKLASATSAGHGSKDVAEYARRAAMLAGRAGAMDLEARALVHFQAAADSVPNNNAGQREAVELITDALRRTPPGPSARRARLLAASARPMAAAARPDDEQHVTGRVSVAGNIDADIEGRLREAVAIARVVGEPEVLSYTLSRLRLYITSPDTLDERVELTCDLISLQERVRTPIAEYEAHLLRHEDLLESGDVDGARIEARAIRRVGEMVDAAGIMAAGLSCLATHATADGDLRDALGLLMESRKLDESYGGNSNSSYRFGIQFLLIRWHQGRIEELYEPYRRVVDLAPRQNAPRASLALICAETGRLDEARAHLEQLAGSSIRDIPKDYLWWMATIFMSHAAIATDAREVAAGLYALLSPYAARNASTAGAISFGSASLILGQLAAYLGEMMEAATHFEHALAHNIRTRQRTWTAHTRHHYATLLAATGEASRAAELSRIAAADAQELGIPTIARALAT